MKRLCAALVLALVGCGGGDIGGIDEDVSSPESSAFELVTTTVNPNQDSYVDSANPNTSYGSATSLAVLGGSRTIRSYIRFNVSGVGSASSAKLRVYVGGDGSTGSMIVYAAQTNSWNASTMTWNSGAPALDKTRVASGGTLYANGWYEVPLGWITGDGTYSLVLTTKSSDPAFFHSMERPSNRPELVLTSESAPRQLLWGGLIGAALNNATAWDSFEAAAGKQVSMMQAGKSWMSSSGVLQYFTLTELSAAASRGAVPVLGWLPQKSGRARLPDPNNLGNSDLIMSGAYDAYIDQQANIIKSYGGRVIIRFAHEADLQTWPWNDASVHGNEPGDYIAMWRYVHGRFSALGVSNAEWWWCPNYKPAWAWSYADGKARLQAYYPGASYVDFAGSDNYNKRTTYRSPLATFGQTYDIIAEIAPGKPQMIGEFGADDYFATGSHTVSGTQAAWTLQAINELRGARYPLMQGINYYNALGTDNAEDYRITAGVDPDLTWRRDAFRIGIADTSYLSAAP